MSTQAMLIVCTPKHERDLTQRERESKTLAHAHAHTSHAAHTVHASLLRLLTHLSVGIGKGSLLLTAHHLEGRVARQPCCRAILAVHVHLRLRLRHCLHAPLLLLLLQH